MIRLFQIKEFKAVPAINNDLRPDENLKNLKIQLDKIKVESVLTDKTKNIIKPAFRIQVYIVSDKWREDSKYWHPFILNFMLSKKPKCIHP